MDITTKSKRASDTNMVFETEQSLLVGAAGANMNELFANLESNIEKYQIETEKDGTISIHVGTTHVRSS